MRRRLLAIFLTLTMALAVFPASALAMEETDLCPHHQTHTEDCGYTEPTEGAPCTHAHTAECYSDGLVPAEGEEKVAAACTHIQHDETCGYSEGSEGSPCAFVCSICPVEAMIEALPVYEDATPGDMEAIEEAHAAYDALSREERAAVDSALADKLADLYDLAVQLADAQNAINAEPLNDATYIADNAERRILRGSGTEADPYLISNAEELDKIRYYIVETGEEDSTNTINSQVIDGYFKLTADIDLAGFSWVPIGWTEENKDFDAKTAFVGIFDGDGHTIKNLALGNYKSVAGEPTQYYGNGLFTRADGAIIKNFTIDGVTTPDGNIGAYASAVVGILGKGTFENITVKNAEVTVTNNFGFIFGDSWQYSAKGTDDFVVVKNCKVENSKIHASGGMVGFIFGRNMNNNANIHLINDIQNCTVKDCEVDAAGGYVGGLCGLLRGGQVQNCKAENVTVTQNCSEVSTTTNYSGVFAGAITGCTVTSCESSGSVSSNTCYIGGFAGLISTQGATESSITECVADAKVEGNSYVGGFVGNGSGSFTNCHAKGDVKGTQTSTGTPNTDQVLMVGGFVGFFTAGTLKECSAQGNVQADESVPLTLLNSRNYRGVGGLVGNAYFNGKETITDCYATGNVSSNKYVGGLVGLPGDNACLTVKNSYFCGTVTAEELYGVYYGKHTDENDYYRPKQTEGFGYTNGGLFPNGVSCENKKLATPEKAGYTFGGWYDNKTLSGSAAENYENDKIYYAKWTLNTPTATVTADKTYIASGEAATLTVSAGHDLDGVTYEYQWYTGIPGNGTQISGATSSTYTVSDLAADTTYYCQVTAVNDNDRSEAAVSSGVTIYKSAHAGSVQITAPSAVTYGDTPFALSYTVSGGGAATVSSSNENVATVSGNTISIVGAGNAAITVSFAGNTNYSAASNTVVLTVNQAPLTITAEDKSVYVGASMPEFTYTVEGLVEGDELIKEPTLICEVSNTREAGTYTITASGADAGDNYTINYMDGMLTISRRSAPSGGSAAPSYPVSTVGTDHGEIDVNPSRAEEGDEVTITVTPDEGYAVDAVTVTDRDGDPVDVTDEGDGVYTFEMPNSRVTIEVTFVPVTEAPETPAAPTGWVNPYGDVAANAWYYDAVAYVSANGLMTGTSPTAFAPDEPTSRAMIWTVLARMNGQNVDGGSPWYALAQSWAMRANVSDGTDPNGSITREQLAAMLYRAAGSPAVTGNLLAYPDGGTVSAWAESAMLWATQNGIISGINGALTPQGEATRAQVAVMLMRFCGVI